MCWLLNKFFNKKIDAEEPKYILQTDKELNKEINDEGCLFRVLQVIGEIISEYVMSSSEIMVEYYILIDSPSNINKKDMALEEDCLVNDPDQIINNILDNRDTNKRVHQIGVQIGSKEPVFWKWVIDKSYDYITVEYRTKRGNKHWVLDNKNNEELYDPYPGIRSEEVLRKVFYKVV